MKKTLLISLIALTSSPALFADPIKPVLHCEIKTGGKTIEKHDLRDHREIKFIGFPIYVNYVNKKGSSETAQLSLNFGSPKRMLVASWAHGDYDHPNGFTVRDRVSQIKAPLVPGQKIEFQFGDDELSVNPTIVLSCHLDKNAGAYNPPPECQGCEGGGGSVSN